VKAALALVERIQPFVDARILEGEEWDADTKIRRLKAWEDAMTSEVRLCVLLLFLSYFWLYFDLLKMRVFVGGKV